MLLVVALGGSLIVPSPAHAAIEGKSKPVVTFGIQPASQTAADARGYFDFNATAGALIKDHVAVINYSYQSISVQVHPTDATNTAEGDFALLPPGSKDPNLGSWLSLPPSADTVTLPPRGTAIIPFTIRVPAGADPGDHSGGILATLQSSINSPSGEKIKLLQSVGTRIFVRVSGPLRPQLTVTSVKITYRGTANPIGQGSAVLSYRVTNTGNIGLGGIQHVYVTGLFGTKTVARQVPRIGLLLPGSGLQVKVLLPRFYPELQMTAHVSISPLVIPGSVQPPSGPFNATVTFWAVPWTLAAAVVTLLVIVAALIIRRRRGRRSTPSGPPNGLSSGPQGANSTASPYEAPASAEADTASADPMPAGVSGSASSQSNGVARLGGRRRSK